MITTPNPTIVCIAGMHRSGTSMLARMLEHCGLYLGNIDDLVGPQTDNPKGFWENAKFVSINNRLLSELNGSWDVPPNVDHNWEQSAQWDDIKKEIKDLVNVFESRRRWGWKDPRSSLVISFWLSLFPNLKIVHCLRNPLNVSRSMNKRGYSSDLFGFNLWQRYNETLASCIPEENRLVTHYDSFFMAPETELRRVLDWIQLPSTDNQVMEACSTIDLALKHNGFSVQDLSEASASEKVIRTYTQLCKVAGPVFNNKLSETIVSSDDAPHSTQSSKPRRPLVKPIAFYLPQYHTIPENDKWWGKGFTEWTNVAKANPLFRGHNQPHIPVWKGYYDLTDPEVRQAQADLAKEYGIHGFCYYHYWFNGKRLLEKPFNDVLQSGKPNFPFCLCWANENWTRAWDGDEKDILMKQNYTIEDYTNHIRWLIKAFDDPRYIRIDGKPLMVIYRASSIPNPQTMTSIWREEAQKHGFKDLYLCRVESFAHDRDDPTQYGFDAAIEFQPDWKQIPKIQKFWTDDVNNRAFLYSDFIKQMIERPEALHRRFPCVTPAWDNTPRRSSNCLVLHESTPHLFETWLDEIVKKFGSTEREDNFLFINAWNEWGEGCHLEPDMKFGCGYLDAIHRAIFKYPEKNLLATPQKQQIKSIIHTMKRLCRL